MLSTITTLITSLTLFSSVANADTRQVNLFTRSWVNVYLWTSPSHVLDYSYKIECAAAINYHTPALLSQNPGYQVQSTQNSPTMTSFLNFGYGAYQYMQLDCGITLVNMVGSCIRNGISYPEGSTYSVTVALEECQRTTQSYRCEAGAYVLTGTSSRPISGCYYR